MTSHRAQILRKEKHGKKKRGSLRSGGKQEPLSMAISRGSNVVAKHQRGEGTGSGSPDKKAHQGK